MEKKIQSHSTVHLPPRRPARKVSVLIEPNKETYNVDVSRRTWTSCCFNCDREVVLFGTKTIITVAILVFAFYRIASNADPCKEQSFEHGLIGMIAGSVIEQGHTRMIKK